MGGCGFSGPGDRKLLSFDPRPYSFRRDKCLRHICVEQKRSELLAAEPGGRVAASHDTDDQSAVLFEGLASREMAVRVIHVLEMIDVHHQDAERTVLGFSPRGLPSELGKEGPAGEQAGKIVVGNQPVDLALVLAVDFIQQVEPKYVLADGDLVAVLQNFSRDFLAVYQNAVPGTGVGQNELDLIRL